MSESLGIVYRAIAAFQIKKPGLTHAQGQCGAITLIQRFGSALNLNIHYHMLVPDGVYLTETDPPYFVSVEGLALGKWREIGADAPWSGRR